MFPTKRQDQNWKGWYSKVFKNQTEEHLVNLCESNKFETQVIFPYSLHSYINQLAIILFPVQSMGNIKFKMTCYRVAADGCICREILIINVCWVSQSVIYQVLNVSAWWCVFFFKFNKEIISHCKKIRIVLLQVKDLIKIIIKFRPKNILYTFVRWTKHSFLRAQNVGHIVWKYSKKELI